MAQEDRNRLAEWVLLFRGWVPVLRHQLAEWLEVVRQEPRLVWEATAVRYFTYGLGGLIVVWIVTGVASMVTPGLPADAQSEAKTADYRVICTNPDCGVHFVIHRKFGFDGFPVKCPKCQQRTGARALRCNSPACRGRWVVPERVGNMLRCPDCGDRLGPGPGP